MPLVAKGDAGTRVPRRDRRARPPGDEGRRELNLRQNSIALLEALLAFAAAQELDKAASAELVDGLTAEARAAAGFVRKGVRTPDLVRVEEPDPQRLPLQFASARALAAHDRSRVPAARSTTGWRRACAAPPLHEHIGQPASPVNGLARFLAALDVLAAAPADELEWAFRGVLDLFSSRLDAWFTSLRHRPPRRAARGAARRASTSGATAGSRTCGPTAARPPTASGYIAAPSLGHAVTAAVLRSGRQAHRRRGRLRPRPPSARVREALKLLEGVAAGQPLAALLGYRIERRLTDAGLADLIVPLRIAAPLQARTGDLDEPVESVAARDVVDGLRLLAMLPTQAVVPAAGAAAAEPGERQTRLEAVLREVAGIVRRGHRRAVRRDRAPDRGRQPRSGRRGGRRARPPGAAGRARRRAHAPGRRGGHEPGRRRAARLGDGARVRVAGTGVRGAAEPRLDHWLGAVLGDPTLLTCRGRLVRGDTVTDLGPVSAAELGLSPLALALTADRPAADQPTELESRLAAVLAAQVADPTEADRIELDGASLLTDRGGVGVAAGERLPPAAGVRSGARRWSDRRRRRTRRHGGRSPSCASVPTPRWPRLREAHATVESAPRRAGRRCAARSTR